MSALDNFRVPILGIAESDVFSICFQKADDPARDPKKGFNIIAQMERAVEFVNAYEEEYRDPGMPLGLTIVGGGVAGVIAALAASQYGIGVRLFEENDVLFSRQAGCDKFIYPFLYDWPVEGWKTKDFIPIPGTESISFAWSNGQAMAVAAQWQQQFDTIRGHLPEGNRPHWDPNAGPILDTNQEKLSDMFTGIDLNKTGMQPILFALGFYQDRCWIDHEDHVDCREKALHLSRDFWGKQHIPPEDCKEVVISGGGDGGLQDFITISTGLTVHELAYDLLDEDFFAEEDRNMWHAEFVDKEDPRNCPESIKWLIENLPKPDWKDYLIEKMRQWRPASPDRSWPWLGAGGL